MKRTNLYTQGQRSTARILLTAWLLASSHPNVTLAAPESQQAVVSVASTSPSVLLLASTLPTTQPGGSLQLPPGSLWGSSIASSPARDTAPQHQPAPRLRSRTLDKLASHFSRSRPQAASRTQAGPVAESIEEGTSSEQPPAVSPSSLEVNASPATPTLAELMRQESVPDNQTLVVALNVAPPDKQYQWIDAAIEWFANQPIETLNPVAIQDYANLACIQVTEEHKELKELLKRYFHSFCNKIKDRPFGEELLIQGLTYVLAHVSPAIFAGDPQSLLDLGDNLLAKLDSKREFKQADYPSARVSLEALLQTLFLAHKVAPGQLNVREGGLYQNFREKLQAIVDGSQYYPVRYQARLLKQTLRLLEDPEPDFSSNLRRIGQGLLGAANLVSVGRGLATGELKLAELQEGITFLQRAVRGRRIEQKPWYSQLLILEKQMLQCLQEEDLQAYPEPAALEERVQAIHMSSLSLKGMATKKVPQYRQALRFGITLQLQTLALSGPTAEVRKGIINQLELLAQPSSWGLDADVMEGLLDGLALVAAQSQADRAAEAAMASQALEKLATSTSASQWLAGKTLKEKLQHLRDQTTTQYTPRAEERLFSYVKKALQIDATITSLKAQEVKNLPELSNHIALTKLLHFIQRKEITDKLTEILQKQDVCVLYGFGGVGKSTLAAHYGHARKDLQTVRWIGAEDSRKLQEGYEQLAQELQVDYRSLAKQLTANPRQYRQELARVVYSALEKSNQAALLILDNAEEASLLEDYLLHRPPHVQALITTRDAEAFEEMYEQLQVDAFSQDEGHRYLEARFRTLKRPYTNQEGASLLETVGLVPQKLKLAAGYLQANKLITTAQYIARLQALQEASTKAQGKLPLPEAALGLETLGEKGQQLMQCVAYLDADFIPLSLVCSLLEEEDPEKLSEVATDLSRLSLMHSVYNAEAALGLQVHREVQACCREYKGWSAEAGLGSPEKILWKLTHVLASQMPWVSATPDDRWQRAKLYAPHVAKVVSRLRSSGAAPAAVAARLLNSMGQYSKEVVRNYPEALEYQKQALQACQDRYQGDHPEVARAWSEIGTTLSQLGQRQQALEHKQQALAMRQRLLEGKDEQDDPELAHALNSVAELLSHLGRHQEALKYKQEGLAMRQWLFKGQDHPDVARSLNSVGISLEDLKQLPEALIYKKEALEMRQRLASNQDHPDIAHSLNNVGETLIKLGQAEEGLDHCKQGWAMRECLFKGQDHPYMAQSLNGVGLGYTALGRHQEAATHYQQAVEVALRVFKGAHPQLTQYYRHLIETLPKLDETTVQQIIATLVPLCSEILGAEHTLTKDLLAASKDS